MMAKIALLLRWWSGFGSFVIKLEAQKKAGSFKAPRRSCVADLFVCYEEVVPIFDSQGRDRSRIPILIYSSRTNAPLSVWTAWIPGRGSEL